VELPEARAQLETALQMTKSTANLYQQIRILLALGSVAVAEGHAMEAEQDATQAIELARANGMENQATGGLTWLGNSFLWKGDYTEAEKYYQEALELARRNNGHLNEAIALVQLGSLRTLQHKTDEGARYVEQALPFLQRAGYRKWVSLAVTLLGRIYRDKGDYEAALKSFKEQLQLGEALDDSSQVALSHLEIGNVLSDQEHYLEALHHFDEGYKIFRSLKAEMYTGYAINNLASVLWQIGRYEEARAALDEASSIANRPDGAYKQLLADILVVGALLDLSNGHFRESEAKSRQALALAGTQFDDTIVQAKFALGLAQARSGATRAGRLLCDEAVNAATGTGDPKLISAAALASAEALLESGEAQGALEVALRTQVTLARFGKEDSEWRAWLIAARASERLGDATAARQYATQAVTRLANLEQEWGAEAYNGYLARQDIQRFHQQLDQLPKP
ncbi:MAG: tetratricopeptide repeat protein, partial [Pyrinomonadaceae bacterium]